MLAKNKKLVSNNLTDSEILELYNKKYNLNEFRIFLYITAYDQISNYLGCNKFTFTEGITKNKNIYNNILVDLYYKNISGKIFHNYPISVVFGIKILNKGEIRDLTRQEKLNNLFLEDRESADSYALNYWSDEYIIYSSKNSDYAGNSYTYFIFKQLIKLFLTEVYLYNFNGNVFTYNEIENKYSLYIENTINYESVK